jgi:hypothetical protein
MKAICFNCHFVGVSVAASRCPGCGYPLIVSTAPARLETAELERVFERSDHRSPAAPLPGVVFRAPRPFLRRPTTRRPGPAAGGGTTVLAPKPRRRFVGEVVAASAAFLAGLFVTLGAFGAF